MSKLEFTLVSPAKKLYSAAADMVIIPTGGGDIGVMAGHSPVLATVRAGTIIVRDGSVETRLFVESGFVEVNGQTATVLADNGQPIAELDKLQAEESLKTAEADFVSADENNRDMAKAKLDIAKARLNALAKQYY